MMTGMFPRLITIVLALVFFVVPASSQSSGNVVIGSDLRLFATLAAMNAAGFDVELGSQYHPVRAEVRKAVEQLDPDLKRRLQEFYKTRQGSDTDEAQIAKYISLALSLTDAPDFKPAYREEVLPPDARTVLGFAELIREVYSKAGLSQLWGQLNAQYEKEMDAIAPSIRQSIVQTDAYLRIPLGASGYRTMSIYVELAAPINSVNVRSNQDNYYVVFGSSASPRLEEMRHAYLHFQLDNIVNRDLTKIKNRASLLAIMDDEDDIQREFKTDFRLMVTESLIRALEIRMDRVAAAVAKQTVDGYYRSGLLLAPYFYDSLAAFEQQEEGIRDYFGDLADGIDLQKERTRFQTSFSSIPLPARQTLRAEVPTAPAAPAANPVRDLLKEAEAKFNAGDNAGAKVAFERVLSDYDRANASAFYGLALIASREGDSEQAQQYFDRTTRSDSADASMKVWAYIYLARLFDLQCERERAIEYYQQALKVGDNTKNALAVAKDGIAKPYGDACRQ